MTYNMSAVHNPSNLITILIVLHGWPATYFSSVYFNGSWMELISMSDLSTDINMFSVKQLSNLHMSLPEHVKKTSKI